ncbi:amidohydrolase family protein [Acetobacteraceae bacterium H6797]|nr:amidohydrolase family protein [Acetobacteraceae bacterium H6797]
MLLLAPDRMLDGDGTALPGDTRLLLEGARIAALLPPGTEPPEGAEPLALPPGCTLLPGLIDLHDYLSVDPDRPSPMQQMFSPDQALRRDTAARHMRRDLLSGVTTQRVMGEGQGLDAALSAEQREGRLSGPALITAGAPIAPSGSHQQRPTGGLDSPSAIRAAIEEAAATGHGWVKLVATGGINGSGLGPTEAAYTPALLREAVAAAHALGLRVAVAAQGGPAVAAAAEAGADTLEHGALLDEAAVDALAANGTAWVLTPGRFLRPDGIPLAAARSPDVAARLARVGAAMAAAVPRALARGLRLGLGADNMHGRFGDDVAQLVRLGAPVATALAAATGMAATILGLADRGTLAPGLRADLLLVDGDPLLAPDALQRVRGVWQGGRAVFSTVPA